MGVFHRRHPNRHGSSSGKTIVSILVVTAFVYIAANLVMLALNGKPGKNGFSLSALFAKPSPTPAVAGPTPTPTPRPRPLTSRGMYDYTVSTTNPKEPSFAKGLFGPVDAARGQTQSFSVWLKSGAPITDVTAKLKIDHSVVNVTLSKTEEKDGMSRWTGSWKLEDSHDYVYALEMVAKNSAGSTNSDALVFR